MKPASAATLSLSLLALLAALAVVPWSWRLPDQATLTGGPRETWAAPAKTWSRADQTTIRVAVTPTPQKQIELSVEGAYQLQPVGSDKVLSRGQQLPTSTVTATGSGFKLGKSEFAVTRLEIVPTQSPAVWVNGHQYRGKLRLFRRSGGGILAVNVLPLGDYLASVVDSEMPLSFGEEARKAQAIAARTYALDVVRSDEGDAEFDVFASTSSQKYLGVQYRDGSRRLAGESEASRKIVRDTTGMVCTYQGRLFRTYYSAACGGRTTQGSAVFSDAVSALKSVPCDYCREARLYRWEADLPKSEVEAKLKTYFRSEGQTLEKLQSIKLVSGSPDRGNEVPEFEIRDGQRALRISAATLRRQISVSTLYSPFFSITEKSGRLHFDGRGHGHAVGLCQWGARGQGLEGKTCNQILRYYYSGASIVQLQ
jgi:stage II sporulation protein D